MTTILRKWKGRKTGGRAGFYKKNKKKPSEEISLFKNVFSFNRKLPAHCADDTKLKVTNAKFRLYNCLQFLVSVILKFTPQV